MHSDTNINIWKFPDIYQQDKLCIWVFYVSLLSRLKDSAISNVQSLRSDFLLLQYPVWVSHSTKQIHQ